MDPTYDLPSEDEYRPQPRLPIRLLIALAVAVATAALGGGAYYLLTRKDVDDHLWDAQIYLDKGDQQAAMIELKNALQREPSHAEARFRLGRLHFSLHDFLAAEKELKLAREQGHPAQELPLLLARTWLALGQPERVLEALPVPKGSGPDVAAPLLALHARAHWLRNDRAAAQHALEQAEALRAGDPEVFITRAMMAVDAAQPEQALALIDQALGQDAKRTDLWMFKGDLKRQTKQTAEVRSAYRKALELEPTNVPARVALANLALADKDERAYLEHLNKAKQANAKDPTVYYLIARHWLDKRDSAKAIAEAEILAKARRHAEASDVFVKAAELARDNRLALRAHEAYVRAGLTQRSMAWLERWLATNPDDYPVRQNLALTQIRAGKLKEAAGHYEQLLKALPRNAVVANNLAWPYSELKDPRALQIAEQAHTLAPDAPEIHYHLAAAQAATGERKAAMASLERLLSGKREFAQQAEDAVCSTN